jgi:carbamoyltransferase
VSVILGLNAFHGDSSACLIVDGNLVAAAEEERFRRIKHWAGFPSQAISACLSEKNLTLEDVDVIAINSNPKANLRQKLGLDRKSVV